MSSPRDALIALALATLLNGPACAQSPAPTRTDILRQRRLQYPDFVRIADLAHFSPPELAADALLRVAASQRNHDPAWKIELLDDAFQLAAMAGQPNRQKIIASRIVYRSRAEILSLAFDQRLDRLSLQGRIIRQMLTLDKAKALDMFGRTAPPSLHTRQCRDPLVDHVTEYYELLAEVVASAFTAEQRRHGEPFDLLAYQISRISSPVEVAPAAKLLADATLTHDELSLLAGRLAASIDRLATDDRSFTASLADSDGALNELARALTVRQASARSIIAAYRRYLLRNFAGQRCADTAADQTTSSVADSFNRNLSSETDLTRAPLGRDDVKPASVEGQADWDAFIDDAEFQQVWAEFLDLLLGKGHAPLFKSTPLSDNQKKTVEWRAQFDQFLDEVDDLSPSVFEPEYRYFYRKATALTAALRVAPAGPDREKVLGKLVALLRTSGLQQESLLEWYAQVRRSASSVHDLGPEATSQFLAELERSGNPILDLYAEEAKALP